MGFQNLVWPQILLRAWLGVLVCAFAGALWGCGSNENPPLSQQDKKPAVSAKPQVKEIFPDSHPRAAASPEPLLSQPMGQPDPNMVEVIPPSTPGGRGVTAAEIKASAVKSIDPRLLEVIPPDKPGTRGLTAAEVMAKTPATSPVDPKFIPAVPPPATGAKSVLEGK